MSILSDEIQRLNQLPDDIRKQAKFDHLVAIMQGETANFSAGVYISLLSSFALAVMQTGLDPIGTMQKLSQHTQKEIRRLLKEGGITSGGGPRQLDG